MSRDTTPVRHTAYKDPTLFEVHAFCPEHAALIRQQSIATMMLPLVEAHLNPAKRATTVEEARSMAAGAAEQRDLWRRLAEYAGDLTDPGAKAAAAMATAELDKTERTHQELLEIIQGVGGAGPAEE